MLQPLMIDGRPHWETRFDEALWPAFEDFRNFLTITWKHLGLPAPTPAQYEAAHRLQYGVDTAEFDDMFESGTWETTRELKEHLMYNGDVREDIIRAFRALGKSYITSAFTLWKLMRNPRDEKVLVISASGSKAKEFVDQTKGLMESMEIAQWLLDGPRENGARRRDKTDEFDVAGASLTQSHSVSARGIDGQITGSRATTIIPDDIEIMRNSKTEDARANILRTIRSDLGPIRRTEHGMGDIIFLGTPQTEESCYNVLVEEMGYSCWCVPVRYPAADKLDNYILTYEETGEKRNILAPYLRRLADNGTLTHGQPTDTRFGIDELIKQESQGRAEFALQYMLDTSLSDAERYPLRQHDLLVFSLNHHKAPLTIQWGRDSDDKNVVSDISNLGFSGDYFLRPLFVDDEWRPYDGVMLYVDPAGRGKDETAWCVMATLGGTMYVLHIGGNKGDPAEAMEQIAKDAKRFKVNVVEVEPNFGQGMWTTAFHPILKEHWVEQKAAVVTPGEQKTVRQSKDDMLCFIQESEWAKGQKEVRIIDTLEPVMTTHRLVVDESVLRADIDRAKKTDGAENILSYSFLYQLTHVTHERGALKHDDRLDAVAGAVAHYQAAAALDASDERTQRLDNEFDELVDQWYEDWEEGFVVGRTGDMGQRSMRSKARVLGEEQHEVIQWSS